MTRKTIETVMNYQEFARRVEHNTMVLNNALENNINLVSVAADFYTFDSEPGKLHFSKLTRKLHDIIPSVYIGALARTNSSGADAVVINPDGSVTQVEMKTSELASSSVWRGSRGGLNTGIGWGDTQKTTLRSAVSGKYTCHTQENLESKNMRTVLLISDTNNLITENTFVDAWEMSGDTVMYYLSRTENLKRDIKLGSFMLNGCRAKTVVPLVGFYALENALQETAMDRDDWLQANGHLN